MAKIPMNTLPWDNSSWEAAAQIAARARRNSAAALETFSDNAWLSPIGTPEGPLTLRTGISQLLLQTVIVPGERTSEGKFIQAVTIP